MGAKSEYYFERLGVYVVTYSLCARFRLAIQNNCGKNDSGAKKRDGFTWGVG